MLLTRLRDESADYTRARNELQLAEIELMRQRERVAALRRSLPAGARVPDYVFHEGPRSLDAGDSPSHAVRLSELFTGPGRSLVVYHLMYGKQQTTPCPMCTMWIDGYNGIARHLEQNLDFVVAAAADLPDLRTHARNRGWHHLRLLSCGDSTFKYDLGSEDAEGEQDSTISVFTRDTDGNVRHSYTAHPRMQTTSISGASIFYLQCGISWTSRPKAAATGTRSSAIRSITRWRTDGYLRGVFFLPGLASLGCCFTKSSPRAIHSCNCSSVSTPGLATYTMPTIGRPLKSNGRTWGLATSSSKPSGPVLTTRSFFRTPQHIWPLTMNVTPPNIFFSSTFETGSNSARTRSASASS